MFVLPLSMTLLLLAYHCNTEKIPSEKPMERTP